MPPVPYSYGSLHEMNTCHAADSGRFCAGAGNVRDERGGGAPAVGERFMVFRVGKPEGSLENRNAGNADSVAHYLAQAADPGTARPAGGTGSHITLFEVSVTAPFGSYARFNQGRATDPSGVTVGRSQEKARVTYAFPAGGSWTLHKRGHTVSVSDFNMYLQKHYGYRDADEAGSKLAAEALRGLFAELN